MTDTIDIELACGDVLMGVPVVPPYWRGESGKLYGPQEEWCRWGGVKGHLARQAVVAIRESTNHNIKSPRGME